MSYFLFKNRTLMVPFHYVTAISISKKEDPEWNITISFQNAHINEKGKPSHHDFIIIENKIGASYETLHALYEQMIFNFAHNMPMSVMQ